MQYKNVVLTNTTIGSFMAVFDSNIVLISLPTIVRELGASTFDALWVIMGYILILATVLLTIGRLADIYGRIRFYNLGFGIFTIGSGLCSVSLNGPMLVIFRLVQGAGAALIFANNAAILTDAFPVNERGRAIGINQVSGTAGSVTGLVAGGVLTSLARWRSIFWVNIPVGIFATFWGRYRLKELGVPSKGEKLDPLGNLLFATGLSLFLLGLTLGALAGWTSVELVMMIGGLVILGAFAYAETKVDNPMMDMKLFKNRAFSGGILSNLLASLARGAVSLVLVFYFQGPLQLDALTAGILLIPFSFAFVGVGPISGYLSDRYGARGLSTTGLLVSALAFAWFALLPINVSYNVLLVPMILAGIGGGMFVAPNIASIMNSVPVTRRGIASGMSSTLISAGVLLSLGVSFAILATSMPLATLQAIFAGLPVQSGQLNLALFSDAMHKIFALMAAISLVAVIPSFLRGAKAAEGAQGPQDKLIIDETGGSD